MSIRNCKITVVVTLPTATPIQFTVAVADTEELQNAKKPHCLYEY